MAELSEYRKRAELVNTLHCSIAETAVLPETHHVAVRPFPLAPGPEIALAPAVFREGLASG